jgi:hypothetical protein
VVNYHKKGYIVMVFFLKRGTRVHKRGTWYYQYALMSPFRDQLKCLVWEGPLCFPPSLLICRPLVFIFALSCDRRAVLAFSVLLPVALGPCWAFTSCTVVLVPLLAFHLSVFFANSLLLVDVGAHVGFGLFRRLQ